MKHKIIVAMIATVLLISSCNNSTNVSTVSSESSSNVSISTTDIFADNKLPSMEDIRDTYYKATEDERSDIMSRINDILVSSSTEDLYSVFKAELECALSSQDIVKAELKSFDIFFDNLTLNQTEDTRISKNISIQSEIIYDNEVFGGDIAKESNALNSLGELIVTEITQNAYVYYKLKNVDFTFINSNSNNKFSYDTNSGVYSEIISKMHTQNSYEEELQKPNVSDDKLISLVFDYVLKLDDNTMLQSSFKRPKHGRDIVLSKFGVSKVDTGNALYAEILIYEIDSYENSQTVIDNLSKYSEEIADLITADSTSSDYFKANSINSIVVIFDIPWSSERAIKSEFKL